MLRTIEVEIDAKGNIHPLEKLPLLHKGKSRALLTILPDLPTKTKQVAISGMERPAFGVLTATRSVTLEEMDAVIHTRGSRI